MCFKFQSDFYDPTQPDVWAYNVAVAKEAYDIGFDEINFDYIRFPTDGPLKTIAYANLEQYGGKNGTLEAFFKFIRKEMGDNPVLSIDVFGMTFTNKDIDIGQRIETIQNYFDVIAPMPYPSHYPPGFLGFENPAEHPYPVIAYTLRRGIARLNDGVIVRPWLQDFDLGAIYDIEKIHAQIQATEDQGVYTWSFWNASNIYTYEGLE